VFRAAVARGWVILELARQRGATLEDIFVRLTTADMATEREMSAEAAGAPETTGAEQPAEQAAEQPAAEQSEEVAS
jgi:hypothetical protein